MQSDLSQQLGSCVIDATPLFYKNGEPSFGVAQAAYEALDREYPGDDQLGRMRTFNTLLTEEARNVVIDYANIGAFLPHHELQFGGLDVVGPASDLKTRVLMHTLFSGYPKLWDMLGKYYNNEFYTQWLNSNKVRVACPYDILDLQNTSWYPQTDLTFGYYIVDSLLRKIPVDQASKDARTNSLLTTGLEPLRRDICDQIRAENPSLHPDDQGWKAIMNREWPKRIGMHVTQEMRQFMDTRSIFAVTIDDPSEIHSRLTSVFDNMNGYSLVQNIIRKGGSIPTLNDPAANIYVDDLLSNVLTFIPNNGDSIETIRRGIKGYLDSLIHKTTFVAAPLKSLLE